MKQKSPQPTYALSEQRYALFHRLGFDDTWEGPLSRSDYTREIREFLASKYAPAPPSRILATGCGDGKITTFLARKGYRVKGVDISPTAIKVAQERTRKQKLPIDHEVGDATCLREPDDYYECIVDTKVHHCLIEDVDRLAHLRQAFRALRPGGVMLFTSCLTERTECDTTNAPSPIETIEIRNQKYELPNLDDCYMRMATPDQYAAELHAAGFRIPFREEKNIGLFVAYALKP